jgi:thiol-disulfide isomerase/thioredoxin
MISNSADLPGLPVRFRKGYACRKLRLRCRGNSTIGSLSSVTALAGALLLAGALAYADDWRNDLALEGLADNAVDGESLQGRAVLLQFWASWCRSCGQLMSEMDEMATRFPSVRYLAVSTDDDAVDARRRLGSHPLFPRHPERFFHDTDGRLAARLDVTTVPTVLVLAADGHERLRHAGHFNSSDLRRLVALLDRLDSGPGPDEE